MECSAKTDVVAEDEAKAQTVEVFVVEVVNQLILRTVGCCVNEGTPYETLERFTKRFRELSGSSSYEESKASSSSISLWIIPLT